MTQRITSQDIIPGSLAQALANSRASGRGIASEEIAGNIVLFLARAMTPRRI